MSAARFLLLSLLVLSAGCASGPALTLDDVFGQSEASYDAAVGSYAVSVQGRLVNHADRDQRILALYFAVARACDPPPKAWAHDLVVEDLAAGGSRNVRTEFSQQSPKLTAPRLAYRLTVDGAQVGSGCGLLQVG